MSIVAHAEERRLQADFIRNFALKEYQVPLTILQNWWRDNNREFFDGDLVEPHIGLGKTAPRSLGHCSPTTEYGGLVQITLNAGLILSPVNRDWVANPWPSQGVQRIARDLLLRFQTRQYVLERRGTRESGYDGFGPRFAEKANEFSLHLGLGPVVARHRGTETDDELWPIARFWPVNVRLRKDPAYYGNDVTQRLLDLAAGSINSARREPIPPSLGYMEYFLYLINNKQEQRLRDILTRQINRMEKVRLNKLPVLRKAELGKEDVDGTPLGTVTFDPVWLHWNNGTVRKIAEAIFEYRAYAELPILADALEDAGCDDNRILGHLRKEMEHTCLCWVLKALRNADVTKPK